MDFVLSAALLCCAALPNSVQVQESMDLVEVNHFYDDQWRHVFDQMIFYQWSESAGRFQVVAWRLIKSDQQLPSKQWSTGNYQVLWRDGDVVREVTASAYRETWTQHDPELVERSFLPREQRRDLRPLKIGFVAR